MAGSRKRESSTAAGSVSFCSKELAQGQGESRSTATTPPPRPGGSPHADAVVAADAGQAALGQLVHGNSPGRVSLAGAYALGYAALGLAQMEGEEPDWFNDVDPLDTLFLGTAFPHRFRDAAEFRNARTAWLAVMRGTGHWPDVQTLVGEAVSVSEDLGEPMTMARCCSSSPRA